ncbi:Spy/CpxP family protein refolding chaperone [Oceanicaulis sp. MMSF_3324]|uniref:Spy/CpxP family protein refolding chaperone n=1 Tax=Oceanicaulis sp. MMSF_3324 TaxID=3046702 RepID=UPI00273E72AC|nr:periplasmic heavy metal sensor [Oceanicaulis sp. MMSF_3324]
MSKLGFYQGLCVVLALAAGALGAWCVTHYFAPADSGPSLHQMVHRELELSSEQAEAIAEIEARYQSRRRALENEMQAANARLAAAIDADKAYTDEVQSAIEDFHGAMGALQRETIVFVLEMREVLTAEQQARFDATVTATLTQTGQ